MTVLETVAVVESRLLAAGVDSPRLDAQMLVAHTLGVERAWVVAHGTDEYKGLGLEELCKRREAREPLAYILGWREFYGRRFVVTPDVLIPRQETETLVEAALAMPHVESVLDVGTGSGCIAITLKLERPSWSVTASDVSEAALDVAKENSRRLLEVANGIRFVRSDLFAELADEQFDLIVSNPPYVGQEDDLPPEVSGFEPHVALFAADGGLRVYRRLAEEALDHLTPGGVLMVEIGDGQSEAVQTIFFGHGWHIEQTVNDLSGTPRVLVLRPLIV